MARTEKLIALLAVFLLAACGTGPKNLSKGDTAKGKQKPNTCPKEMEPYHQVTLVMKNSLPAKVAFELNGVREWDDCQEVPKVPPAVFGERKGKKITFSVMHKDAYPQPPAGISFRLLNLGVCDGQESVAFVANALPLQFVTDYPNGPSCSGRTFAALQVLEP